MGSYDPRLDEILSETSIPTGEGRAIVLQRARYNEGETKIGLHRTYTTGGGGTRAEKLGRLTSEEVKLVVDGLQAMLASPEGGDRQ